MALYSAVITLADGKPSYDDMDMHTTYIEAMYDSEAMNVAGHLLRGRVMMDLGDYEQTPEERRRAAAAKLVIRVSKLSDPEDITKSILVAVGAVTIDGANIRGLNTPKRFKHDPEGAKKWREAFGLRGSPVKRNTVQWTRAEPLKDIKTGEAKIGTLTKRWRGPSLPPGHSYGGAQITRAMVMASNERSRGEWKVYDATLTEEGIAFAKEHKKGYSGDTMSTHGKTREQATRALIDAIAQAHGFELKPEHIRLGQPV